MSRSIYVGGISRIDPVPSRVYLSDSGGMTEAWIGPVCHHGNIDNFRRNYVKPLGVVMQTTAQAKSKAEAVVLTSSGNRHTVRLYSRVSSLSQPQFDFLEHYSPASGVNKSFELARTAITTGIQIAT